jgi:HEAT repeats
MIYATEAKLSSRAKALGESASAECFAELQAYCASESPLVRRIAASAIGKLSGVVKAKEAVDTLLPLLADAHPQVRQYAAKALSAFGAEAEEALPVLRDLYRNPAEKDYVKRSVKSGGVIIKETVATRNQGVVHTCSRCGVRVQPDEYARSQRFFQRIFCDACFDATATERRNWETKVEDKKTLKTLKGTLVKSAGEKQVAEWLERKGIPYPYDGRLRIIEGFQIRPDFYLPERDVYIEYWGMDTPRYKAGMYLKQDLYMQAGKKLISLYPADLSKLDAILGAKLKALQVIS